MDTCYLLPSFYSAFWKENSKFPQRNQSAASSFLSHMNCVELAPALVPEDSIWLPQRWVHKNHLGESQDFIGNSGTRRLQRWIEKQMARGAAGGHLKIEIQVIGHLDSPLGLAFLNASLPLNILISWANLNQICWYFQQEASRPVHDFAEAISVKW